MQIIISQEAFTCTDMESLHVEFIAQVELCNGTFLILEGGSSKVYRDRRRAQQAWADLIAYYKACGRVLAPAG